MKKRMPHRRSAYLSLIATLLLLVALPFLYIGIQTTHEFLTRATGTKAAIIVDTTNLLEPIQPSWNSFAQGGEEQKNMLKPVSSKIAELSPRYIRIDHIYDHHRVVRRTASGTLEFDFKAVDDIVASILNTGAKPFFALSYMPQAIAQSDILSVPRGWNEWALVVQRTIERYSGKDGINLSDVQYEVWNEPDLFGNWKYAGNKNYLTLYEFAVKGAQNAQNVNEFKIGGPATTQLYKNWIVAFADYVTQNKLRLDFISWHRYTTDPTQFAKDASEVTGWLFSYPELVALPRIISEWGFDSDVHPGYDTNLAAAHSVAVIRQAINGYAALFAFEVVDGPDPANRKFWGRWGLLTHPSSGITPKPRFQAFKLLQALTGQRLHLEGEGTWVTGLAAKDGQIIRVLLSNYDYAGRNTEMVPVTFTHLQPGNYELKRTFLGKDTTSETIALSGDTLPVSVIMSANNVALLELLVPETVNPFLGN